ncbi:MAG: DUF1080 domain-containing protein [Pirellulales bacterium]|nr:DUF1080 domain-containing protein [Pirellulales bacterium]
MSIFRFSLIGTLALALCVPSLHAADNELTAAEQAAGWQLLFNGRDHTGWSCNTGKPIATPIEDGCLLPFQSGGYIIAYEKPFGDFILKCDVKMSDGECNSGIFFRVGNLKNPIYTGLEVQVYASRDLGYHDFGSIYDLAKPWHMNWKDGDWNTVEVTCKGPLVVASVNGDVVSMIDCDDFAEPGKRPDGSKHKFMKAIKDFPRSGYLGFQDHGHKVWYKNVKLLELHD